MSVSAARILVVEDERLARAELCARLRQLGYAVVAAAESGEAAVEQAAQLRPELVLMDVNLGDGMDGIAAAQLITGPDGLGHDAPVVFLSADGSEATLARATGSATGYLVKPFGNPDLRAAIEVALVRHEMRLRLAESEERYRSIFENASVGIFRLDASGRRLLGANDALAQMLGYDGPGNMLETIKDVGLQVFAEESEMEALAREVAQRGRRDGVELQFMGRDGDLLWISLGLTAVKAGGRHYLDGTVLDVTRRKEAEEAYSASLALLEQTVQAIADPLAVIDQEGHIILANAAMAAEFGLSEGALRASRYQDVTGLAVGTLPAVTEVCFVNSAAGTHGTYLESVTPFRNPAGQSIGTVRVLRLKADAFKLRSQQAMPEPGGCEAGSA